MQFVPLILAVAALLLGGWMMVRAWRLRYTGGMIGGIFFLIVAGYLLFFWFFALTPLTARIDQVPPRIIPTVTPRP